VGARRSVNSACLSPASSMGPPCGVFCHEHAGKRHVSWPPRDRLHLVSVTRWWRSSGCRSCGPCSQVGECPHPADEPCGGRVGAAGLWGARFMYHDRAFALFLVERRCQRGARRREGDLAVGAERSRPSNVLGRAHMRSGGENVGPF
jgi:hypothetical protein